MCVGYTTIGLLAKLDTALVYEAKDFWFKSKIDRVSLIHTLCFRNSVEEYHAVNMKVVGSKPTESVLLLFYTITNNKN